MAATHLFISASKYHRLLDYLKLLRMDADAIAASVGLDPRKLWMKNAGDEVDARYYSRLYLQAIAAMQRQNPVIPWAGGLGTDAFKMLCYAIIHSKTLGGALQRADEFSGVFHTHTGHQLWLKRGANNAELTYRFDIESARSFYAPAGWDRAQYFDAVAQSSGLRHWAAMAGWLTGRDLEIDRATVAAPFVTDGYLMMLENLFGCKVAFEAENTALEFSADQLDLPIIQSEESLEHFLLHALWQYWMDDETATTTTTAIKSIISGLEEYELPRYAEIADRLNMSASTLRRRLVDEATSYQQIKDEWRENRAIEYLRRNDHKIHEIGELLGFSEPSSFVRSFRKWTGMTPNAYREAAQEIGST